MASIDVEKVKYINGTFQFDGKIIPKKVFVKEVAKFLKKTSEVYGIAQAQAGVAWCYKKGILHVIQDYKEELLKKSIGRSLSSRSNSSLSTSNSITTMTEERNIIPNEQQRRNSQHSISVRSSNSDATTSSTNTITNPVNINANVEDHLDESEPFLMDSNQPNEDIEEIRRLYNLSLIADEELHEHSVMDDDNENRSVHNTTNIILSPPIVPSQANMDIDYSTYSNLSSESLDNNEEDNKSVVPTPITPESISPQSSAPPSPSTPPRTVSLIPENDVLNNNSNIPELASTHYTQQESSNLLLSNSLNMSTNNPDNESDDDDNEPNIESI